MTGSQTPYLAVVMGDLVRSETTLAPEPLHDTFNRAVDAQNRTHAAALVSPLTITLGDEFQGLVRSLAQAAAIVRDLRLALLAQRVDCRFVIGLVQIKTRLNPDKAWNMMGPGLARARAVLNEKKQGTLYRFTVAEGGAFEVMLEALGIGMTAIERRWTDRQRDDITALLGGLSPVELARSRGVSVHSVYKVRASGDIEAYAAQWQAIRAGLAEIDAQKGLG